MKLGKKHYKEARKPLQRATELDGRLFEAWHDLGVIETSLGNFDKAVDDFERALSIQPGARKTLLAYGESLRRAHRPKKAASSTRTGSTSDPNDFDMRARYGQVLREAGGRARRIAGAGPPASRNAGENVSHTVIAYNALALTYYKMWKYELAETALKKASDLDPKSAFVWNNLGLVAFERGHDQEAFLDFQKASELDPKYVQARLNKAVVYLDCGDYKKARTELERRSRSIRTTPRRRSRWASPRAATASSIWRARRTSGRSTSSPTTRRRSTTSACSTWTSTRSRRRRRTS